MNMAVSDLLAGLMAQPIMLFNLTFWDTAFHVEHPGLCNVLSIISATLAYASFYTVAGIALERCLVVRLKQRFKTVVTVPRMVAAILSIWVFALLMVYPIPHLYCPSLHFKYRSERHMCVQTDHTVNQDVSDRMVIGVSQGQLEYDGCKKTVAYVESFVMMFVPVLVVFVSSLILIVSLLKGNIFQSGVVTRSVKTVVIMMTGFICCVLPYCSTVSMSPGDVGGDGMLIMIFLMQLHSAINPVIYLLRCSKFRTQAVCVGNDMAKSIGRGTARVKRYARTALKQPDGVSEQA